MKAYRPKKKPPTVRFETAPGAQGQMDWSTYTIDFEQEGRRRVELFSYILGYSRRQYISFTERQDFEATARGHIAAFEHLGGAAATCLYDNMKVVVTRWEDVRIAWSAQQRRSTITSQRSHSPCLPLRLST